MKNLSDDAESFIYQLIYRIFMAEKNVTFGRSPTLDTVLMVEKEIEKHSGNYNRTELWKRLPKKVMWQTYLIILGYLESINKIGFDKQDKIAYIWNPRLMKKLKSRSEIKV
jgi:hypothetical protein